MCREALKKLRAAVGDESVPGAVLGTAAGADRADVVPAESDSSTPQVAAGKPILG